MTDAERIRALEEAVRERDGQLAERDARIVELERRVRELHEIVEAWKRGHRVRPGGKPAQKPPRKASGRGPGRPTGHRGVSRPGPTRVDRTLDVAAPTRCPACGGAVHATAAGPGTQVVEDLPPAPATEILAYRRHKARCDACAQDVMAPLPDALGPSPKIGVRAQAQIVEMKGDGQTHAQIQRQLARQGLQLSRGGIQQILHRSAAVLAPAREQYRAAIVAADHVWADETTYKVAGQSGYLWLVLTPTVALYTADRSRGQAVIQALLAGFHGVLHSDFYAVYWTLPGVRHAPCWAHLLRTTRQIAERTAAPTAAAFHAGLARVYVRAVTAQALPARAQPRVPGIKCTLKKLATDPALGTHPDVARIQKRVVKHLDELVTFVTDPAAEATNNRSERGLRAHAMARHRSGGARSDAGAVTYALNTSVVRTCEAQGLPFVEALRGARRAYFDHAPFPDLLPREAKPHPPPPA